ncbi:MAG: DUF5985 family protein [Verrucomicrobiales bacterium]|nr:DUF5985 family protein [Verrucomicrobiales bacterium]
MDPLIWIEALNGAIAFACGTIGLLFLRFWRHSHDRLFLNFAIAFWILACERFYLIAAGKSSEVSPYVYTIRLLAFLLIIFAVVDKNRKERR